MLNILDEIANYTRERIRERKKIVPLDELTASVPQIQKPAFPFEKALLGDDIAFICEVKKASPTKGVIAADFPYLQIARDYVAAGAAAISVLTEPRYFQGSDAYLKEIAEAVPVPVLRKDFVVDSYMLYEAAALGASAVLLICAILTPHELAEFIETAHSLGLSALVETHNESEIESALAAGARIIGVNNRDLKTFNVDIALSERLRASVPANIIFVSESGISKPSDINRLRQAGANAVLIGETFMRSADKKVALEWLRGGDLPD